MSTYRYRISKPVWYEAEAVVCASNCAEAYKQVREKAENGGYDYLMQEAYTSNRNTNIVLELIDDEGNSY